MIITTATFVLGSGICGGATNMTTLIAGRIVQGIGAGGINVLSQIIVSDLVPLRERGGYFAITFGCVGVGTALGPFIGGVIVQHSTWRWVLALVLLFVFLHVNYTKEKTFADRLGKIDWAGNIIFIASVTSIVSLLSSYSKSSFVLANVILTTADQSCLGGLRTSMVKLSSTCALDSGFCRPCRLSLLRVSTETCASADYASTRHV
jgi:MFS family permease